MALPRVKRREIPKARSLFRPFRAETLLGKTRTSPIFGETQRQLEVLASLREKVGQFVNVRPSAAPLRRGEYVASHEQDYVGPGPREMNRHVVVVRRGGRSLPKGADPVADQVADDLAFKIQNVKLSEEKPYRDRVEVYALRDGKVLAGTYPDGAVGVYGGGVEPGETLEQAARREYKEEGGIRLKGLSPLDVKPMIEEWKGKGRSAKEKERREEFRGSRTFFFVADATGSKGKPSDTAPITRVRPRSLDALIARTEEKADQAETLLDRTRAESRLEVLEQIKETEKVALEQAFGAIATQSVLKTGAMYHGSGLELETLEPRADHGDPRVPAAVFGSPHRSFALAYAGRRWDDRDFNQSIRSSKGDPHRVIMREMRPGAIKDTYEGAQGYIYELPERGFERTGRGGATWEKIHRGPVVPIRKERIENTLAALRADPSISLEEYDLNHPETMSAIRRRISRMNEMEDPSEYRAWHLSKASPELVQLFEEEEKRIKQGSLDQVVDAFAAMRVQAELVKQAKEFAPGIPKERVVKPIPPVPHQGPNADWMVSLSKHPAARRGDHFDLRLVDQDGKAHSWALQDLPKPGQSTYAAQQPTHTGRYALRTEPFSIPTGVYGATRPGASVESVYVQPTEVISANKDRLHFLRHHGQSTDEFVLRRLNETSQGPVWALHNATKNRATIEGQKLPEAKPKYKEVPFEQVDVNRPNQVMTAKIDGAHTLIDMAKAERMMRVYSYRPTARETGLIEHTFKFPQFHERLVPEALKGTMIRAETWASKDGKAVPASELGGLLNSSVQKSRQDQAERGIQMRLTGIDVVKFKGRDFSNKPYSDKLDALRQVSKAMNGAIELPPMATTPEQKQKLLDSIKKKELPETSEGVVIHRLDKAGPFIKAKVRPDFDVYVRDVFMKPRTEAKKQVGGFTYALEPEGPVVGRVGTGLSAQLRKEMYQDPNRFKGRVAKVQAQGQHQRRGEEKPTGALIGSPAFKMWHLDKTDPELMKQSAEQSWVDTSQDYVEKEAPALLEQSRYLKPIVTTERVVEQSPELRGRMKQILGRMRRFGKENPPSIPYFWDGYYYE